MEYAYAHFQRELLREDATFTGGPGSGDPLPAFDLPTTDGRRLTKAELTGRPFVLLFGSFT